MMRRIRLLVLVLVGMLLVLVGTFLFLYTFTDVVDEGVEKLLNHLAGEGVHIEYRRLSGNLLGTLRVEEVQVIAGTDTFACKRLDLNYRLLDALQGRYVIERLHLQSPRMVFLPERSTPPDTIPFSFERLIRRLNPQNLPRISLKRLTLADGELRIGRVGEGQIIRDIEVELTGEISPEKVEIVPHTVRAHWENHRLPLQHVNFRLTGDARRISLSDFSLQFPGLQLNAEGTVHFGAHPRMELSLTGIQVQARWLRYFWPEIAVQEGALQGEAHFLGEGETARLHLLGAGAFNGLAIQRLEVDLRRVADSLSVDRLELLSTAGNLTGSGSRSPEGNRLRLSFRDIDLHRLAVLWPEAPPFRQPTRINGNLRATLRNMHPDSLTGRASLHLAHSRFGKARIQELRLSVQAQQGDFYLQPGSELVWGDSSRFSLEGQMLRDGRLDVHLSTEDNHLGELFAALGTEGLEGIGNLDLRLTGSLQNPNLVGTLDILNLRYRDIEVYGIYGDADIRNIVQGRQGLFTLEVATSYLGNVFLTGGNVRLEFNDEEIRLHTFRFYSEENLFEITGSAYTRRHEVEIIFPRLTIRHRDYALTNRDNLRLRLTPDSLYVDYFLLETADRGTLELGGYLAFKGKNALYAELGNIRLEPFNQYLYWDHYLTGFINAQADLYQTLTDPRILLTFSLRELTLDGVFLGNVESDIAFEHQQVAVNFLNFEHDSLSRLLVNGGVDLTIAEEGKALALRDVPLDMNIQLENLRLQDYARLLDLPHAPEGGLSGAVYLSGSVGKPQGEMELEGRDFRWEEYAIPYFRIRGGLDSARVFVDSAVVNFMNTEIHLRGEKRIRWNPDSLSTLLADKFLHLEVTVKEDSLNFLHALNSDLDRLIGKVDLSATLEGDYDHPRLLDAQVSVEKGRLFFSLLENSVDDLALKAHLEGARLVIDRCTARAPKQFRARNFFQRWIHRLFGFLFPASRTGDIVCRGWVDVTDITRPGLNLTLELDEVFVNYFIENTRLVVSSDNLRITGRDTILIAGELVVEEGEVEVDFIESQKNLLLNPAVREEPPFVTYDLAVDILPRFFVRSRERFNAFDLRVSGNLRIVQEPREPLAMIGSLGATGEYFIQTEGFAIETGKLDFIKPAEPPEVHLVARKRKNQFLFTLQVDGSLDQPEKKIEILDENGNIVPTLDTRDQMAILLFGVDFRTLQQSGGAVLQAKGEELLTQAAVSLIEQEARSFTGLDRFRLDARDSFFKSRLNRPSTLSLGKYLTPNLYIEYTSQLSSSGLANIPRPSLSWEAGNQIYLEYRLNRNWSFSSIFQKTEEGNDRIRLDIRWRVNF